MTSWLSIIADSTMLSVGTSGIRLKEARQFPPRHRDAYEAGILPH